MRGGESAAGRARDTGVGAAAERPARFRGAVWASWGSRGRARGDCGERSAAERRGRTGWCRASFGKAREGSRETVPGIRAGLAGSVPVPRPGSLQALPFGAAHPAEPPPGPGALWPSCAAVGSAKAPCARAAWGLAPRGVFLVLGESTGLLAVRGPHSLQNFTSCGAGRDSPAPPPAPPRRIQAASWELSNFFQQRRSVRAGLGGCGETRHLGDPEPAACRFQDFLVTHCFFFFNSLPPSLQKPTLSSRRLQWLKALGRGGGPRSPWVSVDLEHPN